MINLIKPIQKQLFRFRKPEGCSAQEINELEKSVGLPLPEAYNLHSARKLKD